MQQYDIAIIGGGASGMVAAINAANTDCSVIICERLNTLGKKVLACGGGRCNLSNVTLNESFYNPEARQLVRSVFKRFTQDDSKRFFDDLGIKIYDEEGRIFPVTNQASSVVSALELELKRLEVPVELNCEVTEVHRQDDGFRLESRRGEVFHCSKLIIAAGGRSYPALGSNGSCYAFADQYGHTIVLPVPSCVPLVVKDPLCHFLQGQRITATVCAYVDDRVTGVASGEVLFTKYGLSGTAVLDVSEELSIALHRRTGKDIIIELDMAPFMDSDEFRKEIDARKRKGYTSENILTGLLPNKWGLITKHLSFEDIPREIKQKRLKVLDTRGWNEAEFTAGGVNVGEVKEETLESKLQENLFFCGEILNVQGKRGGYNLAWAWASGWVAGDGC